jgi:hypothetical protein
VLQERYGLAGRQRTVDPPREPDGGEPEQVGFAW